MANITINLDGNAEQGLEDLDQQLGETVKQVDSLTTSTAKLTEVETQQIKVIHEHHASLTEMVSVSTEVIAKTVGLGVSVAGLYAKQAALAGLQGTVMAGVSGVSGALATQAVRWKLLQEGAEFAGKTVISRVTGMAAPIAAATILLKSYELVMAKADGSPGPHAEAWVTGRARPLMFDSTRDFFAYVLQPENQADLQELFVQDSARFDWRQPAHAAISFIDARRASYVAWQPLPGSMGPTLAPFATRAAAAAFVREHGGAVLGFDEITPALVATLDYRCPARVAADDGQRRQQCLAQPAPSTGLPAHPHPQPGSQNAFGPGTP